MQERTTLQQWWSKLCNSVIRMLWKAILKQSNDVTIATIHCFRMTSDRTHGALVQNYVSAYAVPRALSARRKASVAGGISTTSAVYE